MRFKYTSIDNEGEEQEGTVEAFNKEAAISQLQRQGLVISSIKEEDEQKGPIWERRITLFERVSNKEIVILSRQIATLFQAQVSALKVFNLLSDGTDNPKLKDALADIVDDLKGGSSIAQAMRHHDDIFSDFYVNMVSAGEESGNLSDTFDYLASYLDRNYQLTSKAKNALVYPAFVIVTFIAVMILMLTTVIPNITQIIEQSGQTVPIYTQIVIGLSDFFVNHGLLLLVAVVIGGYAVWWYVTETDEGKEMAARLKLSIPYIGALYRKLYLSRLADNMHTMLRSGIPMTRALQITATVIDNVIYEDIIHEARDEIKSGRSVAEALSGHDEIPSIMVQMINIGEETGELGEILETLSEFYRREVENAVDSLVGLIEPVMILLLGLGVGGLLASVLLPIYNLSSSL